MAFGGMGAKQVGDGILCAHSAETVHRASSKRYNKTLSFFLFVTCQCGAAFIAARHEWPYESNTEWSM